MKICVVNTVNGLLDGMIMRYIKDRGILEPTHVIDMKEDEPEMTCIMLNAHVVLMEVSPREKYTFEDRMHTIDQLRKELPDCKIALLVDERSFPEQARKVKEAASQKLIDAFYYSSVSGEYISDSLGAL